MKQLTQAKKIETSISKFVSLLSYSFNTRSTQNPKKSTLNTSLTTNILLNISQRLTNIISYLVCLSDNIRTFIFKTSKEKFERYTKNRLSNHSNFRTNSFLKSIIANAKQLEQG